MNANAEMMPGMNITVDELPLYDALEVRCVAILWARHASRQNVRQRILDDLLETNGVRRAVFSREKPDLLVVDYDPRHIRIAALLDVVKRPDICVRLVGC